jgi:hypothetical protein
MEVPDTPKNSINKLINFLLEVWSHTNTKYNKPPGKSEQGQASG